jgi:hypothetical protein
MNSVEIIIYCQENHANEEGKCTRLIFNHHKLRAIRECVVVEHDTCYIDVDKELTKREIFLVRGEPFSDLKNS